MLSRGWGFVGGGGRRGERGGEGRGKGKGLARERGGGEDLDFTAGWRLDGGGGEGLGGRGIGGVGYREG